MKKLSLLVTVILVWCSSFAQLPVLQWMGTDSTNVKSRATLQTGTGLIMAKYADTSSINARVKQYPYSLVVANTVPNIFLRNAAATGFEQIAKNWVVNVKDFGALGNGTTNDQTAINLAYAATPEYGTLYLPKGIYRAVITARKNNISIVGDGSGVSILKTPNGVNAASVIELGYLSDPYTTPLLSNITVSGIGLDGNSANVPAPADDLHGWGLSATNVSNSFFNDVRAVDCPSGGVGFFINCNYNIGSFSVARSGYTNTYVKEPGFDINSSKYNHFTITSDSCAYGARVLDNCWGNVLDYTIQDAKFTGLVLNNQSVNKSYNNIIRANIEGKCSDQGVLVSINNYNNNYTFNLNDIQGIGVNEIDSSDVSGDTSLLPHNNIYTLSSRLGQVEAATIGGNNGTWNITSYKDGRSGGQGDYYSVTVEGNRNQITANISDDLPWHVRGIFFLANSSFNKLTNLTYQNVVTAYNDIGTHNNFVAIGGADAGSKLTVIDRSVEAGFQGNMEISVAEGLNYDKLVFGVDSIGQYSWIQALKPGATVRTLSLNPSGGAVGIQTINPDSSLTVQFGSNFLRGIRAPNLPTSVGTKALRINANGTISIADTTIGNTGTVTGTGTANQVTYWSGTSATTGSANFTYTGSTLTMKGNFFKMGTPEYDVATVSGTGLYYGFSNTDMYFRTGDATRWQINSSGHFLAGTDNTYDIGASGATRPRSLYVGTNGTFGGTVTIGDQTISKVGANLSLGGLIVTGDLQLTNQLYFNNGTAGVLRLGSYGTALSRFQLGGTSSSFPALVINGTGIDIKLADNSAYTGITALTGTFNSSVSALGTVSWGNNGSGSNPGRLTYSGADAYMDAALSTGKLIFRTNGSTTALTIDASQGATFANTIAAPTSTTTPLLIGGSTNTSSVTIQSSSHASPTTGADIIAKSGSVELARITNAGNLVLKVAGTGLQLQSGTDQRFGNATLIGGTVTVNNTTVGANSYILFQRKTSGGTIGTSTTYTISNGTSFTLTSDNILDTSVFTYFIFEGN